MNYLRYKELFYAGLNMVKYLTGFNLSLIFGHYVYGLATFLMILFGFTLAILFLTFVFSLYLEVGYRNSCIQRLVTALPKELATVKLDLTLEYEELKKFDKEYSILILINLFVAGLMVYTLMPDLL